MTHELPLEALAEQFLSELGAFSVDELAAILIQGGYRGTLASVSRCPVARYIAKQLEMRLGEVVVTTTHLRFKRDNNNSFLLPATVAQLIKLIDRGDFPELIV